MMSRTHMMRISSWVVPLLCLSGALCRADQACGESVKQTTYPCVYRTCRDQITVTTPEGERVDFFTCGPVACCQQLFTSCYDSGDPCSQAMEPAVREHVAQVAATSRVLVADCRGRYALYEPQTGRGRPRGADLATWWWTNTS